MIEGVVCLRFIGESVVYSMRISIGNQCDHCRRNNKDGVERKSK